MIPKIPLKFGDVLVYVFILILIGGSFAGLHYMGKGSLNNQVAVEVNGTLWGTYDIPAGSEVKELRIEDEEGNYNVVVITSEGTYIEEANCPDQICVNWGKINRPGQTIVCLPHRLVISIIGNQGGEPPLADISS